MKRLNGLTNGWRPRTYAVNSAEKGISNVINAVGQAELPSFKRKKVDISSWSPQICGLIVWAIQVLIENFGHGEHVYPILLEDGTHSIVT